MWTLKADWIIPQIVDQFIDRNYPERVGKSEKYPGHIIYMRKGLSFKLRMRVDEYSNTENTRTTIDNALVMFCSNTSVFHILESDVAAMMNKHNKEVEGKRFEHMIFDPTSVNPEWWINSSNHDSCWRSDGFSWLSERYFSMCYETRSSEKIAPADLSSDLDFGFGKVFEFVNIYTITDPENEGGYWQKVIHVERDLEDTAK